MSSNEKTPDGQQLRTNSHQTPEMGGDGSYNSPRPPKFATESRVLNMVKERQNNEINRDQQAQPQQQYGLDFSKPPPQGNHMTQQYQSSREPLTLPEIKSTLSATAKEFVPRGTQETGCEEPLSNADGSYSLSVSAPVFVPRVPDDYIQYNEHYSRLPDDNIQYSEHYYPPIYDSYLVSDMNALRLHDYQNYPVQRGGTGNPILDRFNNALLMLNMHPGNMEEYLRPICEMIQKSSTSTETVNDVVESLFIQGIQEQNFRYTGARICQFLTSNLKSNPMFSGFHKIFMKRCQSEYEKRESLLRGEPYEQERLRGLAMFMAEIFLNVETEVGDGGTERIRFLPKILIDFVQSLLSEPNDANVKCSCQLLKLSGALMEDIVKSMPEDCIGFESIFGQLEALKSHQKLSDNARFLLSSVIDLKNKDWNRSVSSPPKKACSFPTDPNNFQVPEPVFYHNGAVCSRADVVLPDEEDPEDNAYVLNEEEEAAFLEWQAEQEGLANDQETFYINDTGEEVVDDGCMGPEEEEAYEEFLQEQNNYIQGYQSSHGPPPPLMPPAPIMYQAPNYYMNQPPPNPLTHLPPPNQQPQEQHPPQQPHGDPYQYHRQT